MDDTVVYTLYSGSKEYKMWSLLPVLRKLKEPNAAEIFRSRLPIRSSQTYFPIYIAPMVEAPLASECSMK